MDVLQPTREARPELRPSRLAAITLAMLSGIIGATLAVSLELHASVQGAAAAATFPLNDHSLADQLSQSFERASSAVSPSVVAIFSEQHPSRGEFGPDAGSPFGEEFFRRFFQGVPRAPQGGRPLVRGLGSGVIVSHDGLILTNNHVVDGADKLTVLVGDHERVTAKVVGTDPASDLAVVRIDPAKVNVPLTPAPLGDSDSLKVGEWVIAVGNPFQLMHTVTAGIVSARGRSTVGLAAYEDYIQTDASINPGNSGGALADLDGNLVGINTAISSPTGGSVGLGFAIPINMAKKVMAELSEQGRVTRGYLALVPQDVDADLARALHMPEHGGALVGDVTPDGPADHAGLHRGDLITGFNGAPIHDASELRNRVAEAEPGSKVELAVLRDGHVQELAVVLGERPSSPTNGSEPEAAEEGHASASKLGLYLEALTPDIAAQLDLPRDSHGVVVAGVEPGSPAEEAGLTRGDVIEVAGGTEVGSPAELARALHGAQGGESLAFLVRRGGNTAWVAITMP